MKYFVWFTICEEIEADSSDDAFEIALEHIGERGGNAEIVKHQVLEE